MRVCARVCAHTILCVLCVLCGERLPKLCVGDNPVCPPPPDTHGLVCRCVVRVQNCTLLSLSSVQCFTSPGIGTSLVVSLVVNSTSVQSSSPVYINYDPPTITRVVSSTTATNLTLATVGNDTVIIYGET